MSKSVLKIVASLVFALMTLGVTHAYTIGGAYAQLVSCTWGQYGYQYGNIGTYNVNGKMYEIFFGSQYCPS